MSKVCRLVLTNNLWCPKFDVKFDVKPCEISHSTSFPMVIPRSQTKPWLAHQIGHKSQRGIRHPHDLRCFLSYIFYKCYHQKQKTIATSLFTQIFFPHFWGGATVAAKEPVISARAPPHLCDRSGPPAPTTRGTGRTGRPGPSGGDVGYPACGCWVWLWVKSCQKSIDQMGQMGQMGWGWSTSKKKLS